MKKELFPNGLKIGDCVKYNKLFEKKEKIDIITEITKALTFSGTLYRMKNCPELIIHSEILEKIKKTPRRKLK